MLPTRKGFETGRLIDGLGRAVLKHVVRPPRVAGKNIAQRAIVDDFSPRTLLCDELACAVEVGALALDLLEASRLTSDDRLGAWLAALNLCAVRDAVAQLTSSLAHVRGGLTEHASRLGHGLHRAETGDALPVLSPRRWTELEVGGEVVAAFVFREVWLTIGVPAREADVAHALAE